MEAWFEAGETRALGKRALGDRLPRAVLDERGKGYQAVDWHEGLTAAKDEVKAEVARIGQCGPAADTLDVARLQRLVAEWPTSGWSDPGTVQAYRLAWLRGISAGHFLRKVSGANQ